MIQQVNFSIDIMENGKWRIENERKDYVILECPALRLHFIFHSTIVREANGLPYEINVADEFTSGGVRQKVNCGKAAREATLECPALRLHFIFHSPFSIFHFRIVTS